MHLCVCCACCMSVCAITFPRTHVHMFARESITSFCIITNQSFLMLVVISYVIVAQPSKEYVHTLKAYSQKEVNPLTWLKNFEEYRPIVSRESRVVSNYFKYERFGGGQEP